MSHIRTQRNQRATLYPLHSSQGIPSGDIVYDLKLLKFVNFASGYKDCCPWSTKMEAAEPTHLYSGFCMGATMVAKHSFWKLGLIDLEPGSSLRLP